LVAFRSATDPPAAPLLLWDTRTGSAGCNRDRGRPP
jgi:hypothetical protein